MKKAEWGQYYNKARAGDCTRDKSLEIGQLMWWHLFLWLQCYNLNFYYEYSYIQVYKIYLHARSKANIIKKNNE